MEHKEKKLRTHADGKNVSKADMAPFDPKICRTQNTRKVKKNIVVPKQEGTNVVIDPGVCCCSLTVTPIFLFFSRFV